MLRFLLNLISFVLVHFHMNSIANAVIIDPNGILPKVDSIFTHQSFNDGFKSGDSIQFTFEDCLANTPCGNPSIMTASVESKSIDEIQIKQSTSDGKVHSVNKVTQSQWELIHRNYFRAKINSLESFGFNITLLDFLQINCPKESFLNDTDLCYKVHFQIDGKLQKASDIEYVLWASPLALGQILSSTQKETGLFHRTINYKLVSWHR